MRQTTTIKELNFNHGYCKLIRKEFTTIRKTGRYFLGDIVNINVKHSDLQPFNAVIINKKKRLLADLPLKYLQEDTAYYFLGKKHECKTKKECFHFIQSFYKKKINFRKDKFFVYRLRRVKDGKN